MHVTSRLWSGVLVLLVTALLVSACDLAGGTEVSDLETRNAQLQGTIDVMGTPGATIAALEMTAERSLMLQAEMNNVQGTALAVQGTLTAQQLGGGGFVQSNPPAAPAIDAASGGGQTANVTPGGEVPSSSGTTFYQTTTATGRDNQDCPVGETAIFDSNVGVIYVITRASNLKAGSTISARWTANGTMINEGICWTPDSDWADVCAYCDISAETGLFETGSWTVELLLDDQLLSQAQFQVVDQSADTSGDDTLLEETPIQ